MHRYERNAILAPEAFGFCDELQDKHFKQKYCLKLLLKSLSIRNLEMCIGQCEFLTKFKSTEA